MGEIAGVAEAAPPAPAEVRAWGAGVVELAGIAPSRFLSRVGIGALGPVVHPPAGAPPHLKLVHPELVAGVFVGREVHVGAAADEEVLHRGDADDVADGEGVVLLHPGHRVLGYRPRRRVDHRMAEGTLAGRHWMRCSIAVRRGSKWSSTRGAAEAFRSQTVGPKGTGRFEI
ncbi:hypothetical protein MUK42_30955 [Musa troglodytarum]|uniref:Uncharacterized protein n=1 Tax=Musa troglodytarum TaxID=320322 RepID=A0A9E7JWA0_9LILI|nr:hypothetical protein MUK42_30955 [Musa troglodytarum]